MKIFQTVHAGKVDKNINSTKSEFTVFQLARVSNVYHLLSGVDAIRFVENLWNWLLLSYLKL